jgi:hypothetical protein
MFPISQRKPCSLHDVRAWRQTFPTQLGSEWALKQRDLSVARKRDEDRLTQLQSILKKVSVRSHTSRTLNADKKLQGPSNAPKKVKVKVTIHEKLEDQTDLGNTTRALFPYLLQSGS